MIRQFFKDSFIYSISGIFSRGISLLLLPVYTRIFDSSDYGVIDYMNAIGGLVAVTVGLEITQGMARYYAEATNTKDKIAYGSTTLWFTFFTYILFAVLVVLFKSPLSVFLFGNETYDFVVVLAAISFVCNGLVYVIQNQLRWNLHSLLNAKMSMLLAISTIVLTLLNVVILKQGVSGVFLAQIEASMLVLVIGYFVSRSSFAFQFDFQKLKQMLQFSLPLVPSSVGVVAALYVDRIAVKNLLSLHELGVFGVGYRIASIVSLAMIGFQSALTPLIYVYHKEEGTPRSIALIFRLFVSLALILFAVLSLFSPELVRLITPVAYHEAYIIVPPMVFGVLLWQMYIFAPGLSLEKRTGLTGVLNVVSALLNLGLNYLLIPIFGMMGSALATACSAAFSFLLYMYFSQRYYPVPHQWSNITTSVIITIVLICGILQWADSLSGWEIVLKIIALLVLLVLLFGTKMIMKSDLKHVLGKLTTQRR